MDYKYKVGDIITLNRKQRKGVDYHFSMNAGGPYWKIIEEPRTNILHYFRCLSLSATGAPYLFYPEEILPAELSELEKVVYRVID